jgi:hypothetical protein
VEKLSVRNTVSWEWVYSWITLLEYHVLLETRAFDAVLLQGFVNKLISLKPLEGKTVDLLISEYEDDSLVFSYVECKFFRPEINDELGPQMDVVWLNFLETFNRGPFPMLIPSKKSGINI